MFLDTHVHNQTTPVARPYPLNHTHQLYKKIRLRQRKLFTLHPQTPLLHPLTHTHTYRSTSLQYITNAPVSVPFVHMGLTVDKNTVYTSDRSFDINSVLEWFAIIRSGYIGLEISDVYTSLGSKVTFVESLSMIMPTFDR